MEYKSVLLRNPKNNHRAWFKLPFYFGQLSRIGLSGDYRESVVVEILVGDFSSPPLGLCSVEDLEALNRQAEGDY